MILCTICSHENPDDAKFCQNCGHALEISCANCGTPNAAGANFCKNCGQTLVERREETPQTAPEPGQPARMQEAERRVVTLLFGDVVGSTSMGELIDPEEWTEIMNGMFDGLIPPIEQYGGTVARLMGDGLLAIFGAPITHEDDPYRAVLAALDMINGVQPYQEKARAALTARGIPLNPDDLEVRIGINTGLAIVGEVGAGDSLEYTAMGDAVNLAARMEQTAEPGTIQIANDTYIATHFLIKAQPLEPLTVKGKRDPVHAYRVLGVKRLQDSLPEVRGMESPLIGRDQEMERLSGALANLGTGQGRLIALTGEGGNGKSRLVRELYELSDELPVEFTWYEAESLSFEGTQPYGLIQRLLRRVGGIARDDAPQVVAQKIEVLSRNLDPEVRSKLETVLRILFGIAGEEESRQLQGEEFKKELFTCVFALGEALVANHPTILVFEDLHWTDSASLELIESFFPMVDQVPLLLVCVYRPFADSTIVKMMGEAKESLGDSLVEISLKPLTAEASNHLVGSLLDINDLPQQVGSLILDKSSGVPYFIEEIVHELIESGVLVRADEEQARQAAAELEEIEIPDSLEAVLVSRMDRLDMNTRRTLQLAAVIGRSFYLRVLKMIAESSHLDQHMDQLQQMGLILEFSHVPELQYIFQHVLAQEAAYNTILIRHRRLYHQQVGEAMEEIFADQVNEQAPLLAYHFQQAGDRQRALQYLSAAARNAGRLYANEEAINHYNEAISIAVDLAANDVLLANLYQKRGRLNEIMGDYESARADLEEALAIGRGADDALFEWRVMLDLGNLWTSRDYNEAGVYYEEALALARSINDPAILAQSLNRLGNWNANAEHPQQAIAYHREALDIIEQLDDRAGLANTLDLLGMANLLAGNSKEAHAYFDRAVDLFRELDNRFRLASSLTTRRATVTYNELGSVQSAEAVQTAERSSLEALQIAQEIGWLAGESFAYWVLGFYYALLGEYDTALQTVQRGLAIAKEIDHRQWMAGHEFNLSVLYADILAGDEAQQHAQHGMELARETGSQYWTNQTAGTLANAYLLRGDLENCRKTLTTVLDPTTPMDSHAKRYCWLRRAELALAEGETGVALDISDRLLASFPSSTTGVIPTIWRLRGEALAGEGHFEEAEAVLREAIDALPQGDPRLWRLHAVLGDLYRRMGRPFEAEELVTAGRQEVEVLAATIPDDALKANFKRHAFAQLQPPSGS